MQSSNLFIQGQVISVIESVYEGSTNYKLQFLIDKGERGFSFIDVKIVEVADVELQKIKKNTVVSIPVKVSTANNNLYYSQNGPIKLISEKGA